jgi:uncharacterized Zn finger protein (UPF0148 family)
MGTRNLQDVLPYCLVALEQEIARVKSQGSKTVLLTDGHQVSQQDSVFLYSFTLDVELILPDDSPAELAIGHFTYPVTIVTVTGFTILLQIGEALEQSIPKAQLRTSPWFLLDELHKRLEMLHTASGLDLGLSARLLTAGDREPDSAIVSQLMAKLPAVVNLHQREAIARALSHDVTFIWGPPGTGKTTTIGYTVAALVQRGEAVLVTAHSNAAVDAAAVAVGRILHTTPEYADGRMLRIGITRSPGMNAYQPMLVREVLRQKHPELIQKIEALEAERDKLVRLLVQQAPQSSQQPWAGARPATGTLAPASAADIDQQLASVKESLKAYHDQLRAAERELIAQAQVVLCTLLKATIAEEIYTRRFNAVIVDEASMAYIPSNIHVAALANQRIIICGDFRQLPPIVQGDTPAINDWLKPDIFEKAGIVQHVDTHRPDPRLTMLTEQHRMHPDIAAIIRDIFYAGRLTTHQDVASRCAALLKLPPERGRAVALLDIGRFQPLAFKESAVGSSSVHQLQSNSRFNLISALIALELAYVICQEGGPAISLAIITPYAAQARLINKLLLDCRLLSQVVAATVHRFQGSERDIIIYDTVESKPFSKAGLLLSSLDGRMEKRLLNVAISRARGKLVLLADMAHLRTVLPGNNIYLRVLQEIQKRERRPALVPGPNTGTGLWGYDPVPGLGYYPHNAAGDRAARADLINDLRSAETIAIALPDAGVPGNATSTLLPALTGANIQARTQVYVRGARRTIITISPTQHAWEGPDLHALVVGMDQRVLWIESPAYTLRLAMPHAVKLLYGLWSLLPEEVKGVKTSEQQRALVAQGKSPLGYACPRCGSPLWPQTEGRGSAMLVCTNAHCRQRAQFTESSATQWAQFMKVVCPECGGPLVGKRGSWGIYLRCLKYPACKGTRKLADSI